eukprot:c2458_g1_i1.p1 GENE.c2458_g1_i1~~c2458_g1_i1.p1  ORF type:complete len:329 (-),score=64.17 c2458_g1_i1:225-1211(-)
MVRLWEEWVCFSLFACNTIVCIVQALHSKAKQEPNRKLRYGVESTARFRRWTFRTWFQALLLLSNFARMSSTLLEIWITSGFAHDMTCWRSYLLRALPSLFFFSTFSMIILFWAPLIFVITSHVMQKVRSAFFVFNILAYVVFVTLDILAALYKEEFRHLWEVDLLFSAGLYGVGLCVALTYSHHILPSILRSRRLVAPGSLEHHVFTQTVRLLIVSVAVFAIRCVWSLVVAMALLNDKTFRRFYYDMFILVVVEFLPTLAILFLIIRPHPSAQPHTRPPSSHIPTDDAYRPLSGQRASRTGAAKSAGAAALGSAHSQEFLVLGRATP